MQKSVRFELDKSEEQIDDPAGTLRKALKQGDMSEFRSLLPHICDAMDAQSDVAQVWIKAAASNVSLLTHKYVELVQIILRVGWLTADDEGLAQCTHSFIENLVSAHSNYLLLVCKNLIPFFSYTG